MQCIGKISQCAKYNCCLKIVEFVIPRQSYYNSNVEKIYVVLGGFFNVSDEFQTIVQLTLDS